MAGPDPENFEDSIERTRKEIADLQRRILEMSAKRKKLTEQARAAAAKPEESQPGGFSRDRSAR